MDALRFNKNSDWQKLLENEFEKAYFKELIQFVNTQYTHYTCFPKINEIFNAFNNCSFNDLKVVIIGQDPYHTPGVATGLAFESDPPSPSLKNIRRAIANEYMLDEKNEEIKAQSELIKSQSDKLAEQHQITLKQKQEIIDSINYAKRIQQAIFPTKEYIDKILNEHFILFRPRDIVSGDFYWMRKIKNFIIVVAADSTGHGVPGAFMSMLGVSFLNEIVSAKSLDNAGEILNRLRDKVKKSLHQTDVNSISQDGMDIAFYIINTETLELQYSGAYNPLFIVRKNQEPELIEIKADRQPIAIFMREKEFSSYNIQLQKGDCIYTFSDGYADQFGGQKGQKFKLKNFKQILLDIYDLPMKEQNQILKNTLEDWMGNTHEQLDDILVLGVRVDF
ncbi:MAG: SpoIIE family protein phosphatase [Bacteroidales bacterium]|nr:SpoIIE family protein phosphatase [Bacteroidales bacterium]